MRVYFDTNVLVSAFATRGLCADVLRHVLTEHELLTGEINLLELRKVLLKQLGVPRKTVEAIEELIHRQVVVPHPKEKLEIAVRDPSDAWVLASAVAGNADVLVTGDKDLLEIASSLPLPIVNPRGFWNMIRSRRKKH